MSALFLVELVARRHGEKRILVDLLVSKKSTTKDQCTRYVLYFQQIFAIAKVMHFIFQRDRNTDNGKEVYLYHNKDRNEWYFASGSSFNAKNNKSWLTLDSLGKILTVSNKIKIALQFISAFNLSLIKQNELRTRYSKNFWNMARSRFRCWF